MGKFTRGEFMSLAAILAGAAAVPRSFVRTRPSPAPAVPQARGAGIEADLIVVRSNR